MSPAPRVLPYEETKKNMKAVLNDIQDGTFAGKWIAENKTWPHLLQLQAGSAGSAPDGDRGRRAA